MVYPTQSKLENSSINFLSKEDILEGIKKIYFSVQNKIVSRLNEFKQVWETGKEEEIFHELIFCILTPQSKAKFCWQTVENLLRKNLLLKGSKEQIAKELNMVRFRYKKAEYIIEARKQFLINDKITIKSKIHCFKNPHEARAWLVRSIKGIGFKEASHFLRNIGFAENLAILDRHILKNLKILGVIEEVPNSLSRLKYFQIEEKMKELAEKINIPLSHLDLLMWYKETGEIFK